VEEIVVVAYQYPTYNKHIAFLVSILSIIIIGAILRYARSKID